MTAEAEALTGNFPWTTQEMVAGKKLRSSSYNGAERRL